MHVALLFPPAVDPRSPHLAIAALAASLRQDRVRVTVHDLNLEGLLWLVEPEQLTLAAEACSTRLTSNGLRENDRLYIRQILARASFVIQGAKEAIAALRDRETFYDPNCHHEARNTLRYALALASAGSGRIRYNMSNAIYEVEGVDCSRLRDLAAVTADPTANLFLPLWETTLFSQFAADRPDIVGVSILNGQQIIPGLTLARLLRNRGYTVVIGGTVYAKFVPHLLKRPDFFRLFCHGVVPYEGETALRALVDAIENGRDLSRVPNFISLDSHGSPVMGPNHIEDVNSLPPPDFTGLPLNRYLAPEPVLPILTGKGCYFNRCKFCDIPYINSISTKPYRVRRPEIVAADIATLHRRHGARHFVITDETLSPHLLLQLAEALDDHPDCRDIKPCFVGYARFEKGFTPAVCARLHHMGMRKLFFGLESGSQATLDHMDKGSRLNDIHQVLRNCVDAGIAVHVFSIIGFPQENEASARETLAFFLANADTLSHPRNSFDIHRFGLDLRTEYYENAAAYGALIDFPALETQDFPITVKRWQNSQGLDEADVERLLEEFTTILRQTFIGTQLYPEQHWPGFEEYAVLYGDRYEVVPFRYRTALPPAGDLTRFQLKWANSVRFGAPVDGTQMVWNVGGSTTLSEAALVALAPLPATMVVDELLGVLAKRFEHTLDQRAALIAELREVIDLLLASRTLWYSPEPTSVRKHTTLGPSKSGQRSIARHRLRPDVGLQVRYDDRTAFGSPVGPRPAQQVRRLYRAVIAHAQQHGIDATISAGPTLLQNMTTSSAFGEIAVSNCAGTWMIRPEVLYPDPPAAVPVALHMACPTLGAELTVDIPQGGWQALSDLIARLSSEGCQLDYQGNLAELVGLLERRGLLTLAEDEAIVDKLSECQMTFVGHNTVQLRSHAASLVIDPFFVPADRDSHDYRPLGRSVLGRVDAILVTHSHPDHFDPGSLLQFGPEVLLIVPHVEQESLLTVNMALRLRELGFTHIVELGWGEVYRVHDLEVHALPFFGEQPTSGAILHPEVRNQGNTYVIKGAEFTAALVADSGRDHAGDIRDVAAAWKRQYGAIDILFAGYRGWFTYPVQLLFSSVAQYVPFIPPDEWGVRQQLMNDAEGAIDLAERWGAAMVVPYAAGGAPWYWSQGLGPRLDGLGDEDPSFDPWPERVAEAAVRRLFLRGSGWVRSSVEVRLLRPGDSMVNIRGNRQIVRMPKYAWPW